MSRAVGIGNPELQYRNDAPAVQSNAIEPRLLGVAKLQNNPSAAVNEVAIPRNARLSAVQCCHVQGNACPAAIVLQDNCGSMTRAKQHPCGMPAAKLLSKTGSIVYRDSGYRTGVRRLLASGGRGGYRNRLRSQSGRRKRNGRDCHQGKQGEFFYHKGGRSFHAERFVDDPATDV